MLCDCFAVVLSLFFKANLVNLKPPFNTHAHLLHVSGERFCDFIYVLNVAQCVRALKAPLRLCNSAGLSNSLPAYVINACTENFHFLAHM